MHEAQLVVLDTSQPQEREYDLTHWNSDMAMSHHAVYSTTYGHSLQLSMTPNMTSYSTSDPNSLLRRSQQTSDMISHSNGGDTINYSFNQK
jgi:hypothetical protein